MRSSLMDLLISPFFIGPALFGALCGRLIGSSVLAFIASIAPGALLTGYAILTESDGTVILIGSVLTILPATFCLVGRWWRKRQAIHTP